MAKKEYKFNQRVEARKKGATTKTIFEAEKVYPLSAEEAREYHSFIELHAPPAVDEEQDEAPQPGAGGEGGEQGGGK